MKNPRREQFSQLVARGETATSAYVEAFGQGKASGQLASRLLKNANVSARVAALRQIISAELLGKGIREVDGRVKALEKRAELLQEVIDRRAEEFRGIEALAAIVDLEGGVVLDTSKWNEWRRQYPRLATGLKNDRVPIGGLLYAGTPAGVTGLIRRDYRGKNAERVIFQTDVPLLSELRAIERQAAEELGQWKSDDPGNLPGGLAVQINVAFVQPDAG